MDIYTDISIAIDAHKFNSSMRNPKLDLIALQLGRYKKPSKTVEEDLDKARFENMLTDKETSKHLLDMKFEAEHYLPF